MLSSSKYFRISYFLLIVRFLVLQHFANGKVYEVCEIVHQLQESNVNEDLHGEWVCLSQELSQLNSSSVRREPNFLKIVNQSKSDPCHSFTLGLFQISNNWCTTQDHADFGGCTRNGCRIDCLKLMDDDISDDIKCLKIIQDMHGSEMWSQKSLIKCQHEHQAQPWNHTNCFITGDLRSLGNGRMLTSVPLWAALLIVAVASLLVFGLTYFFYKYRRNSMSMLSDSEVKEFRYGMITMRPQSNVVRMSQIAPESFYRDSYNNIYEVPQAEFAVDQNACLGSGAYGVVYKAMCRGKIVAAKALKPHATKEYLQSLLGEIKILSHVGRHDFIVNMEAAYTKDIQKGVVYIFMEYCGLGSLEKFLRKNRANYISSLDENGEATEKDLKPDEHVFTEETHTEKSVVITSKHLLQYAHQIARGMEFLSSQKVIHSDLASRNILLVDQNSAKISDFGLSRKLYDYMNYIKTKEEPLPWRWMAIESLREMNFSTASDVWMYGVLLSEIFSLGGVPYPGLSWSLEFVDNLEKGFRMLRPKHAPVNVYKEVMLRCWEVNPDQRPSFTELSKFFYKELDSITAVDYTKIVEVAEVHPRRHPN